MLVILLLNYAHTQQDKIHLVFHNNTIILTQILMLVILLLNYAHTQQDTILLHNNTIILLHLATATFSSNESINILTRGTVVDEVATQQIIVSKHQCRVGLL